MENDLPRGAIKYQGKEVRQLLDSLRTKDIALYEATNICMRPDGYLRSFGAIESGEGWHLTKDECYRQNRELFNGQLSPTVDDVNYYRGVAIPRTNGTVFLYTPMMQPWIPEQRKETFQVYIRGKVTDEEVVEVVKAFSERYSKGIDRKLARIDKADGWNLVSHLFSS